MDRILFAPGPRSGARRVARHVLWLVWLATALWLAARHDVWRDEVRALSVSLQGDSAAAMLHQLGEGHPSLWYLMLRGAHAIWPSPLVLPVTAFLVAAAATLLLALRSPFRAWVIALVLFGGFGLFEFTIMARNYGISMLILFAIAWRYPRARGWELGLLLALLANTNLHSAMLALVFLLFWGMDKGPQAGWRWRGGLRQVAIGAGITLVGLLACLREIYPTVNDAIPGPSLATLTVAKVASALLSPAQAFDSLAPAWPGIGIVMTALLVAAPLGLIRAPAAALAAAAALAGFELFFGLAYPGSYRHAALFLVFLIALYWIVGASPRPTPHARLVLVERLGSFAFAALLALQLPIAVELVIGAQEYPQSRARDLAALLRREHLDRAIVIANPEANGEALPFYADNPIWLLHEHRFGRVTHFTRAADRDMTLAQLLATGERLRYATGRPIVFTLRWPLDATKPRVQHDSYVWSLSTTPAQVHAFQQTTQRLASFGPALSGETFQVYRLR